MTEPRLYAEAGVNIAERTKFAASLPGILARARRPEVLSDAGPFSGLFAIGAGYKDPVIAASADGIGTKVKLHLAADRLDLCGPDIMGHSVNDVMACGAQPIFFLDYLAGSGLTTDQKQELVTGMAKACEAENVALLGGETADMPGVYADGEFDVAGFIVGVVERADIIDGSRIKPGHVLLGLPSSGLHTNGFALARRVLDIANGEPTEDTRTRLEERPPQLGGKRLGEAILTTHRAYYRDVKPVIHLVDGMAHITGGGYPENLPRTLPAGLSARVDVDAWEVPGLFRLIQQRGEVSPEEMYEVFNMGIGLVLYIDPKNVAAIREAIPEALPIGEVTEEAGQRVVLRGLGG